MLLIFIFLVVYNGKKIFLTESASSTTREENNCLSIIRFTAQQGQSPQPINFFSLLPVIFAGCLYFLSSKNNILWHATKHEHCFFPARSSLFSLFIVTSENSELVTENHPLSAFRVFHRDPFSNRDRPIIGSEKCNSQRVEEKSKYPTMPVYNFKQMAPVPSASDLVDIVLTRTQRRTPTVVHPGYKITRIRSF